MWNSRLVKQFRNVMKIFGVAVAVYLALTLKVWLIGESDDEISVVKYDYLATEEEDVQNEIVQELLENEDTQDAENNEHEASSIFSKLCTKYKAICNKVNRSGTFNDKDKAMDFAYVIYILQHMDKNVSHWTMPSKALTAMLINEAKWSRRGSAWRNTVTINVWWMIYDNEFFQVVSHELGHIIDLWWMQWVSKTKSAKFTEFGKEVFSIDDPSLEYYKYSRSSEKVRKSWMTREDFCSGYGMTDPFEDFAECNNLFLNHHDYFRKIAMSNETVKNKYNYFSNLYWGKYINNSEANYENRDKSFRARDTTKLMEG